MLQVFFLDIGTMTIESAPHLLFDRFHEKYNDFTLHSRKNMANHQIEHLVTELFRQGLQNMYWAKSVYKLNLLSWLDYIRVPHTHLWLTWTWHSLANPVYKDHWEKSVSWYVTQLHPWHYFGATFKGEAVFTPKKVQNGTILVNGAVLAPGVEPFWFTKS